MLATSSLVDVVAVAVLVYQLGVIVMVVGMLLFQFYVGDRTEESRMDSSWITDLRGGNLNSQRIERTSNYRAFTPYVNATRNNHSIDPKLSRRSRTVRISTAISRIQTRIAFGWRDRMYQHSYTLEPWKNFDRKDKSPDNSIALVKTLEQFQAQPAECW
jgi:hypothetical protein